MNIGTAGQTRAEGEELLALEDALARMLSGVEPLPAEEVALDAALGRILAQPLVSRLTLPPWDNSAMDGFAVLAADVAGARPDMPVLLGVTGEAAAGHAADVEVRPGSAVRILTGAALPPGADAVVPVEETRRVFPPPIAGEAVAILGPVTPGAHVRQAGSDLRAGELLLERGRELRPAQLAVAAAGGHGRLSVHRRPRVGVLATGDELVPPGEELGPAQIPDSNSIGLLAQAREAGAEARTFGMAGDRLDGVIERLQPALVWADVVVVSGGVSVGVHDMVKAAFAQLGRLDLWRVAVQPGKPLAFARAPRADPAGGSGGDGARDVLLFGLPGNPVSSFVTFELFVRPVVRRLAGHLDASGREVVRARLAEAVAKAAGRRAFLRVRLEPNAESAAWRASLAGGQGSHVLSALAAADGLAIVPEEHDRLPEGAIVEVLRLDGPRS